jgi:hypothetical protein
MPSGEDTTPVPTRVARLILTVADDDGPEQLECSQIRVRRQGSLVYLSVRPDREQAWSDTATFDRTRLPRTQTPDDCVSTVQRAALGSSDRAVTL